MPRKFFYAVARPCETAKYGMALMWLTKDGGWKLGERDGSWNVAPRDARLWPQDADGPGLGEADAAIARVLEKWPNTTRYSVVKAPRPEPGAPALSAGKF